MSILIVEDDVEINKVLVKFLSENGYDTISAFNGKEAYEKWEQENPELILMDLMLPMKSGERVIKEIREKSNVPIIVISAKSAMEARLEVLRTGADDYILKPFDLNEVMVRMQVVLRRAKPAEEEKVEKSEIVLGDLVINVDNHTVNWQGQLINLTSKELQVLILLAENPQKTFTKANLYESIWQDTYYYEDNTINVHLSNLRNKLKKATGNDYVETVWGIGYRLKQQL